MTAEREMVTVPREVLELAEWINNSVDRLNRTRGALGFNRDDQVHLAMLTYRYRDEIISALRLAALRNEQSSQEDVQGSIGTKRATDHEGGARTETAGAMLCKMIRLATERHAGQFDKGGRPYILHPLTVMHRLRTDDEELQCIAVGHDLVEDTATYPQELRDLGFSNRVVSGIIALTKMPGENDAIYRSRVKENPDAVRVKIEDLRHNSDIRRLKGVTPKDVARMVRYHEFYLELKAVAETDANAPGDTGIVSGVSAEPNHRQPHAVSQGWRDIETAPRDGTPFLCFHPDDVFSAQTGIDLIWYEPSIKTYTMDGDNEVPFAGIIHWMPLPAPPSPDNAKTGGAS